MADFNIDVIVDPRKAKAGLNVVDREMDKTARTANQLRDTINKAFAFVGIGVGISQLIKLTDTFTNLQNRLKTVTDSQEELAVITNELFEISNRTRISYEATAEVYTRTANAVKELGLSQEETLQFTESLNQAVALSGASATEAQAGLIQLSQGLASGTLRGDELNSVLEQLPIIADVITKSLGVTRGELRELGADGAITAEIVTTAFREAREELAEGFAEAVPTVSQSFAVLQNEILRSVGAMDEATGASATLAGAILFLAENLEVATRILKVFATVLAVDFARRGIGAAIAGMRILTVAIAANPIGAIVVVIGLAVSALITFADKIKISSDGLTTLADVGTVVFQLLIDGVTLFVNFFNNNFGFIGETATDVFKDIDLSVEGVLRFGAQALDNYIALWVTAFKVIIEVWRTLPAAFKQIFTEAINQAIAVVEFGVNKISQSINTVTDFVGLGKIPDIELDRIAGDFENSAKELGGRISTIASDTFGDINIFEGLLDKGLDKFAEAASERRAAEEIAAATIGSIVLNDPGATQPTEQELIDSDVYLNYLQSGAALYGQALADRNAVAEEYNKELLEQDQAYAASKIALDQQVLSNLSSTSQGLTNLIKSTAGENTTAYRIAFLAQQGFALATIALNTELAATAALAPPPIGLGPVAGAGYAAAIRISGGISAGIVAAQTVAGLVSSYSPGSTPSASAGGGGGSATSSPIPQAVATPNQQSQQAITVNITGTNLSQSELTQAMKDVFDSDAVVIEEGQAQFNGITANG